MKNYSFYLIGGFRYDITASTPHSGLNKILKNHGNELDYFGNKIKDIVTDKFIQYDNKGLGNYNFRSTEKTTEILNKFKNQNHGSTN